MDLKKQIVQKIMTPVVFGSVGYYERIQYNKYIKSREYAPLEENLKIQQKKLYDLVCHATANIPYYKEVAKEIHFSCSLETIFEDVKRFPVLTKDIIRSRFGDLHDLRFTKRYKYSTSGGSTGEPVRFIMDHRYLMRDWTYYAYSLAGYELGDKLIRLWGSEKEVLDGTIGPINKLMNKFYYRTVFLNSFRMTQDDMARYVNEINRFQPKVILAYVQSAYELAKYILRTNQKVWSPEGVIVSAGTCFPDFRKVIEEAFKAPVFNSYGSREAAGMAFECDHHEGLHVNTLCKYLEILNDDLTDTLDGQQGKVHVTLLENYTMPFIRFEIGDMAVPTSHQCSCGRGWPLIENVVGRTVHVIRTADGTLIDGEYFTHLFYFLDFVHKFQVVQEDYKRISIHIVSSEPNVLKVHADAFSDMVQKIRVVMGEDCTVDFEQNEDIPSLPSGKYVYTVSKINE